jgi:hypothetical protein
MRRILVSVLPPSENCMIASSLARGGGGRTAYAAFLRFVMVVEDAQIWALVALAVDVVDLMDLVGEEGAELDLERGRRRERERKRFIVGFGFAAGMGGMGMCA